MTMHMAYGSNMDLERLEKRIGRRPSRLLGHKRHYALRFNKQAEGKPGIGWANIVRGKADDEVYGIVYDLDESELKKLDKCERVEEGHYRRKTIIIELDGKKCKAIVYVACRKWVKRGLLPTPCYVKHLLGGRDLLPPTFVADLEKQPTREPQ